MPGYSLAVYTSTIMSCSMLQLPCLLVNRGWRNTIIPLSNAHSKAHYI